MNSEKKPKNLFFRMHKKSYLMIAAAMIIVASIFLSPVFSTSTSPCSSCHGGYYQYFDVLEGNVANQLPTTLNVGQAATVTVVVENNVNTVLYSALSSVSLTLSSQSGHFAVSVPTYSVGTLQKGTATATWQITGVSAGSDTFVISASARNIHQNLLFQDSYFPAPGIVVSTLTPMPTPTPTLTSTTTLTTDPTLTPDPASTSTPTPTQTQTSTTNSEPTPNPKNEPSINAQEQNKPSDLKIWFTTLNEGETLTAGNKTIEWTTSGGSGNSSIKLEISKSESSGPWITLAENLTTSDSFFWNVPNLDSDYIIRAIVSDSANPLQNASVTVTAKVNSTLNLELLLIVSSYALLTFSSILVAMASKNRLTKTGALKNKNMLS
jgi:hypothetical protein